MRLGRLAGSVLCSFLLCNLALVGPLFGQEQRGSITGRAVDRAGAILQGAHVEIEPSGISTATNAQGEFTVTGLAPGSYSVTVSYVGFAPFTTKVQVSAGQAERVSAQLNVASSMEQVSVTERVHGEVEAINRARESDNILQVLPVEVITSLPNTNIADALGRLPSVTLERDEGEGKYVQIRGLEPRLSNVTINGINVPSPEGDVRQIKLDVIPANLVESVEINKTLSANQDGDAIGGSVNLVTKTAEEKPTLYINGVGGYTPIIGGRSLTEIDGTIGKRFGASKKLGILFGSSYDWNGRGIDDIEPSLDVVNGVPVVPSIDLREYRYYRTRYGFTGSVDYKLGDLSGVYIRGLYSHFDNFGDRWVYSPSINTFVSPTQGDVDGSVDFSAQIRRPVEVIGSLEAGGKHVFTNWTLAYNIAASRSASEDHGYSSAKFGGPSGPDSGTSPPPPALIFNLDWSNPHLPKLTPQSGQTNGVDNLTNIYDPSLYSLSHMDMSRTYSPQVNLQGGFSASRSYHLGGHFSTFEFGAKFRNAHKFEDATDPVYDSVSNPVMTQFVGSFTNPDYYDHAYTLGPTVDYRKVTSYFNANPNDFTVDISSTAQNSFPNNYDLLERVSAGYLMNTTDFGRLRLQAGIRFEGTNESVLGNKVLFDGDGNLCGTPPADPTDPNCLGVTNAIQPVSVKSSYVDPLPSVQVRYQLPHDAAIRAAYGRGVARPNYNDLPPFFNAQLNSANQIDVGNPNLKPTYANNLDLLYEQFLKPVGLLQAGFFYKQISDPIYEGVKSQITTDQYGSQYNDGTWFVTQPINGKSAQVYGFEIAYQQHWTFLPGPLAGIGIFANYGYTHSSTDGVPGRSDKPALLRQAPHTWNISPTYDRGRISARLGLSYNAANIFQYNYSDNADLGIKGPNGDVYLYSHLQVDAQAQIRVYRGVQLVVGGLNLTNEVFGFYQGSPQFLIQREYYKPSYIFGLRYTLSNEPR